MGKVEAPERGENHPRTHHSGRVQEHIDSRVLERQLLPRLLDLELASDAHEIAHPRGDEEVEAPGLEAEFLGHPVQPLPAGVCLCVTAQSRAAEECGKVGLAVHATGDEGSLGGQRVLLGREMGGRRPEHEQRP